VSGSFIDFQAPPQEGVNFANPTDVANYFSSLSMAIALALEEMQRQMNNPQHIMMPTGQGRKPLSALGGNGWQPGDIKLTWSSERGGSADNPSLPSNSTLKSQGWVLCDGKNGTQSMNGAFALGTTSRPGTAAGSTSDITSGGPSSLIQVIRAQACDTQAQAGDHVHTHNSDVDGSLKTVTFVFLMRI
jgi:hypothetical protein